MTDIKAELVAEIQCWPDRVRTLTIASAEDLESATRMLQAIKRLRGEIAATFDPVIKRAHEAHRAATAAKKKHDEPLATAEQLLKGRMAVYREAEAMRAREEQARLAAQAREAEMARRRDAAIDAALSGDEEAAAALLGAPVIVFAPAPPAPAQKVDSVTFRACWRAEVVDMTALVRWVAANVDFIGLLNVNEPALNALARAQRETLAIPGVRVVRQDNVAVRA